MPSGGVDAKYYDLVQSTRERLASRQGDIIAQRGVRLIDTMLSVGGLTGSAGAPASMPVEPTLRQRSASGGLIDLRTIVAQFLANDAAELGLHSEGWDRAPDAESPLNMDMVDGDFDTWFQSIFEARET